MDEAQLTDDIANLDRREVSKAHTTKIETPEGVRAEYARILTILLQRAFEAIGAGHSSVADNNFKAFLAAATRIGGRPRKCQRRRARPE